MKKYFALLLAVLLVFSCALPAISADDVQNDIEITESTASEPQVLADPSSEPIPLNSCAHENKEFVEAQEPTCTHYGHIAYYRCLYCGSTLDENGNAIENVTLAIVSHVSNGEMYDASFTPCYGGYKEDYGFCIYCYQAVNAKGNLIELYPAENTKHTPGNEEHEADYQPCCSLGGYKDSYYTCIYCNAKVDKNGDFAKWYAAETDKHTPGGDLQEATYTPCGGGYAAFYYCALCGEKTDADGNGIFWTTPETDIHTPDLNNLCDADYTPCGGGYKDAYYRCIYCSQATDANGNAVRWSHAETSIHTPGNQKYNADYVPCRGGYKTDHYVCIYCNRSVDNEGIPIKWTSADPEALHTPGNEKYTANYMPCRGGYKTDYSYCIYCGTATDINGNVVEETPSDPNAAHTPGSTKYSANYIPCYGGYKEDHYYCKICGSPAPIDAEGHEIQWSAAENNVHTPGTTKYPANFTPCSGGIKVDYCTCIYCGSPVDSNGNFIENEYLDENKKQAHVLGNKFPADYKPCKGGYTEDWYQCTVCGHGFLDKDGKPATYVEPSAENAHHTPGKIEHKANYSLCGGGYKDNFFYCVDCGKIVDKNGDVLPYYNAKINIHTPSIEVYPANYSICNGGYKTDYHKCIDCGRAVGADGEYTPWYGGLGLLYHIRGEELYPADYTPCGGGCLVDYYICTICGQKINTMGLALYHSPYMRDPVGDHTLEVVSEKAPTYTEDGNKAYWQCSVCKKAFSDEAGETEITDMSTVILPKLEKPRVDIAEGLDKVPETVSKWFPTVSDILEALRKTALEASSQLTDSKDTISILLDVQLQIQNEDGTWTTVTHENFPANGVDTVLPYPAGTSKLGFNFTITHMITSGDRAGEIEVLNYTLEDDGIHVHFDSMSPVMITYNKSEPKKDEPKKDDTKPDSTKKDDAKADNTNASSANAPKTGDNENYAVWAALLLLSGSAVAVLLKMNRAQRKAKHS